MKLWSIDSFQTRTDPTIGRATDQCWLHTSRTPRGHLCFHDARWEPLPATMLWVWFGPDDPHEGNSAIISMRSADARAATSTSVARARTAVANPYEKIERTWHRSGVRCSRGGAGRSSTPKEIVARSTLSLTERERLRSGRAGI